MTTSIKKIGKHGLIYGIGIVVSRAASFIMLPIYTRYLSPSDYGAAELLTTTVDVIGMIVGLGIAGAIFKCYSDAEDEEEKKTVISTATILLLALNMVSMALGIFYSKEISSLVFSDHTYSKYFELVFITYFIQQGVSNIPLMYIRAIGQPVTFVTLGFVKLVIQVALNLFFLIGLEMKLMGVVMSALLGEAVVGIYLITYVIKKVGFKFSSRDGMSLFKIGSPFVITSISSFVLIYSDRYFLRIYENLSTIGIYALAYKFGFILSVLVVVPFQSAWEPLRYGIAKQEDGKSLFKRVFLYFNIAILSVSVLIVLTIDDVLKVISSEPYWPAAMLVPYMIVNTIIQAWTFYCDYGLYHARKTSLIAASSSLAAMLVLLLNYQLIPRFGAVGAVLATFGAFLMRFGLMFFWAQKYYLIEYGWGKVAKILLLAVLVCFVRAELPSYGILASLMVSGFAFILFLITTYYMILQKTERDEIFSYGMEKINLLIGKRKR